jgi:hypothetical protein
MALYSGISLAPKWQLCKSYDCACTSHLIIRGVANIGRPDVSPRRPRQRGMMVSVRSRKLKLFFPRLMTGMKFAKLGPTVVLATIYVLI